MNVYEPPKVATRSGQALAEGEAVVDRSIKISADVQALSNMMKDTLLTLR